MAVHFAPDYAKIDEEPLCAGLCTSQIPVEHWHQLITQLTLADAVMDRIIHNAHRIELKGDSMRKNTIQKD